MEFGATRRRAAQGSEASDGDGEGIPFGAGAERCGATRRDQMINVCHKDTEDRNQCAAAFPFAGYNSIRALFRRAMIDANREKNQSMHGFFFFSFVTKKWLN